MLTLLLAAPAWAVIDPARILDGPNNEILDVEGAAMAADGSGGILYRKEVNGVAHLFVAPLVNGAWGAPVQVDGEDPYGAGQAAIGAAEGGRLLVVWVQPRNVNARGVTVYALMSASLQAGASGFGPASMVDPEVSEPYTGSVSGIDPEIAMAPSGKAYVVYRVITDGCESSTTGEPMSSSCVPGSGDKLVEVRVAQFNYLRWNSLGSVNRAPRIAMLSPTAANAPSIGIDLDGNGIVAWQEPSSAGGPARIWVRRLFGTVKGNVLEASPETIGGRPVTSDAETPAVGVSPYGEAKIAFRIHGASGSAVTTTQLYTNTIGSELGVAAAELDGAVAVPGALGSELGAPSASVEPLGDFRVTWTQGQAVRELGGTIDSTGAPQSLGVTSGQTAQTTINPAGGGTTAWLATAGSAPAVRVREDYPQGAFQLAQFGGGIAGPIGGLSLAGSGHGDALIGWSVGSPGYTEVLGDFVRAPPAQFVLDAPKVWVNARDVTLSWETPYDAVEGITYAIYVDGKPHQTGLTGLSARLNAAGLGSGVHHVQVLATDTAGQETMSTEAVLKLDASPPLVRLKLVDGGSGVRVTVVDHASGVEAGATSISFGDGHSVRGRTSVVHAYAHAGTYTIAAHVRDNAGNAATVHLRVRVR